MQPRRPGFAGQTRRPRSSYSKKANTSRTPTAVCRIISAARSPNGKNSFYRSPASFGGRFNIDVRIENEAVGIDTAAKSVEVRRADGSTYTESYDKLLLSPGASPVRPPLKGIDSEGIFTLRNVDDTDRIKNYITTRTVASAVVVGAGFTDWKWPRTCIARERECRS